MNSLRKRQVEHGPVRCIISAFSLDEVRSWYAVIIFDKVMHDMSRILKLISSLLTAGCKNIHVKREADTSSDSLIRKKGP